MDYELVKNMIRRKGEKDIEGYEIALLGYIRYVLIKTKDKQEAVSKIRLALKAYDEVKGV